MGKTEICHLIYTVQIHLQNRAFFHIWNPHINSFIEYLQAGLEQLNPTRNQQENGIERQAWLSQSESFIHEIN